MTRDGAAYGWGDYGRESTLGVPRHGGGGGAGGGAEAAMRGPLRYGGVAMDLRFMRDAAAACVG